MELIDNYFEYLRNFTNFSGTATRKEFWLVWVCNLILSTAVGIFLSILGLILRSWLMFIVQFLILGAIGLVLLLPSIAITMRRLHDAGFSGWFILVSIIPAVGGLALIVLCALPSKSPNVGYTAEGPGGYGTGYSSGYGTQGRYANTPENSSQENEETIDF